MTSVPRAADAAIRMEGVGVCYRQDVWAVRQVSTEVPVGSVVAVVGANGSGKTSLLRTMVGLRLPKEGSVELFGRSLDPNDATQLSAIAYVGQRKPLYQHFRVHEVLRFGQVTNAGWDGRYALQRLRDANIDLRKRVDQLSGGQRTQLALTVALAKRARLLVLDEPLSDLDPLVRRQVFSALLADVAGRQATAVLSSHVVSELELTCDRLLLLHKGRLILDGGVEDIVAEHVLLTGPSAGLPQLVAQVDVIDVDQDGPSVRLLGRTTIDTRFLDPRWQVHRPDLNAVVLGYLQSRQLDHRTVSLVRAPS